MKSLLCSSPWSLSIGYWLIRIGVGGIFTIHGAQKLFGGVSQWQWLGSQMSFLGITSYPLFWGFAAMLAELLGGICLMLGFGTRLAALAISGVLVVALIMHWSKGDGFAVYSHALLALIIMVGIVVAGSGHRSVDARITGSSIDK